MADAVANRGKKLVGRHEMAKHRTIAPLAPVGPQAPCS
jgi:hypothetical protein